MDISKSTFCEWMKREAVEMPASEPPRPKRHRNAIAKPSPTRLLELSRDGISVASLSLHYGVGQTCIRRWLLEAEALME
jgi:hypothetical protein